MKKSFRVATVFTGAAAAAAAFTPAAAAMPVATGPATHDLAPGIAATGNVTATDDCGSRTEGWLYLYYAASEHHGPVCLGGTGIVDIKPGTRIAGYCTGNTYGSMAGYYLSQHRSPVSLNFHFDSYSRFPTESFSFPTYLTYVYLSGTTSPYLPKYLCSPTL
jgi:hypothetical protein